jgi:signal transduction histidine kinase/CheY-like chemotaxis protein
LLVLASSQRDARITSEELAAVGVSSEIVNDLDALCEGIHAGAGAALLTEEHLTPLNRRKLQVILQRQPAWSDFPLLVIASKKRNSSEQEHQVESLGNVTILQAPLRIRALVTTVRSALRSRRRQYNARRAIEQRDRFLAMLGHELRNPLAAISFALEALSHIDVPLEQVTGVLRRQTAQLSRLVDDLLDVSRVSTGKIELHRERVDLATAVSRSVASLRRRFEAAGIQLQQNLVSNLPVYVDPSRLDQILGNLLTNAVKYTPRDGTVTLTLRRNDEGFAEVVVEDTGLGIERNMLDRIFDEFVQIDTTLARSQGGMGIGLTLVRKLVELHGGTVGAHSAGLGQGSRFIERLPVTILGEATTIANSADRLRTNKPRRVVIVEDNDDSRQLLMMLLEEMGHEVQAAADGKTGLELVSDSHPDAALVDIGLPEIDGYELARRLRQDLGRHVHLVAISGYGQPEDRRRALEAGFDEHLTKPPAIERLQEILDNLYTAA